MAGMRHKLNLRQMPCSADANQRTRRIEVAETRIDFGRLHTMPPPRVDGSQNTAGDWELMRCELEVVSPETELLKYLAGVAMSEDYISREIVGHAYEMRRRSRMFTCAGNARIRIGDDVVVEVNVQTPYC